MENNIGGQDREGENLASGNPVETDMNADNSLNPEIAAGERPMPTGGTSRSRGIGASTPLWLFLLAVIGVFIVASFIGAFAGIVIQRTAGAEQAFVTFTSNAIALTLTVAFAIWMSMRRGYDPPLIKVSLKRSNPSLILWGLLLVIAVSIVLEPLLELFPQGDIVRLREVLGNGGWAVMSVVVLAPVMEEILFRGLIQDAVSREYGTIKGVLISAAIFGLVHQIPVQIVNAFFIGIILGYIYVRTRSLIPVMVIHAVNNAIAYIGMTIDERTVNMTLRQIIGADVWYWIVYGVCAALTLLAAYNVMTQLGKLDRQRTLEEGKENPAGS